MTGTLEGLRVRQKRRHFTLPFLGEHRDNGNVSIYNTAPDGVPDRVTSGSPLPTKLKPPTPRGSV